MAAISDYAQHDPGDLLMFAEIGLPLLAATFLNISALIIAAMILVFSVHEATALWDVSYATTARTATPIEQLP
jgi:hypothetical protein